MKQDQQEIIATATGLSKRFKTLLAVENISFSIYRGECLGVLGPNGAGKTTLLKMLIGHVTPTSGQLNMLGFELPKQARPLRAYIGVVPQFDNLDPDLSIQENLEVYASYFGMSQANIRVRVNELLQFAALAERSDAKVNTLSGGMKRRLSLARALLNQPKLLILDEPTTGLDPQARQVMWERLRDLKHEGATQILTTHYLEEAERLCDRILVVDHGRILAEGKPKELIEQNIEKYVLEIHSNISLKQEPISQLLPNARIEKIGASIFCYAHQEHDLNIELPEQSEWELLHRRANLEDVFLKLTGRELRE